METKHVEASFKIFLMWILVLFKVYIVCVHELDY
jgi:hypothetical protein